VVAFRSLGAFPRYVPGVRSLSPRPQQSFSPLLKRNLPLFCSKLIPPFKLRTFPYCKTSFFTFLTPNPPLQFFEIPSSGCGTCCSQLPHCLVSVAIAPLLPSSCDYFLRLFFSCPKPPSFRVFFSSRPDERPPLISP